MVNNGIAADMVVIPEPTSNRISVASGGYVFFQLTTRGNPGATYRRGGATVQVKPGEDAIEKMLKAIPAIKQWGAEYTDKTRYHGEPAGNVNVIAIEGGHPFRASKLPCFCHLYLEVGHMPGQLHCDIIEEVKQVTRELKQRDPCDGGRAAGGSDGACGRNFARMNTSYAASPRRMSKYGASARKSRGTAGMPTRRRLTRAGIPSICYGPQGRARGGGTGYYPKEGEHVNIDDLTKGTEVFIRTAIDVGNVRNATRCARRTRWAQSCGSEKFSRTQCRGRRCDRERRCLRNLRSA